MKTLSTNSSWAQKALLITGIVTLSSCALPPRQAWDMIQRDGLINYWAYAAGRAPMYARSSPPLMSGSQRSLAYRPPYARYGESWYPAHASAPRTGYTANRYYAPSTTHVAASQSSGVRKYSGNSSSRHSKPRVASKPRVEAPEGNVAETPTTPDVPPAAAPKPETASMPKNDKPADDRPNNLPYGSAVAGRPNMVNSPYADKSQLVDVAGMAPGQTVKCPYTGKLFKVPPSQQAANKAESKLEPKEDKPASKSEPPAKP